VPWTLLSLIAGWWGIPWGLIFTSQSLYINLRGGNDVTNEVANALRLFYKPRSTHCKPSLKAR